MSRRQPSDTFTRFTSSIPHASKTTSFTPQRPPPNPSTTQRQPQQSRPPFPTGPEGETPAQKVARLRAASRLAKEHASLSATDRLISRGRTWADFAHRATTYTLLAFTGVSSVVAIYGVISLVSHNRRQKRAWIERELDRLHEAQQAFLRGEANAEQLHLLEQERAGEQIANKYKADKQKRKEEGMWASVKGTFGSFMGEGDRGVENTRGEQVVNSIREFNSNSEGRERLLTEGWVDDGNTALRSVNVEQGGMAGVGLDDKGRPVPINRATQAIQRVDDARRTGEKAVTARTGIVGGPLDVLAENVVGAVVPQSQNENQGRGWFSWVTGSGKSS